MLSRFSVIVAIDVAGGIAKGGTMPWPNSAANTFFRDTSTGNGKNAVIMGRCTYDSIPRQHRPLEGRHVYVISTTWRQEDHQEVTICESVLDALTLTGNKVNSYEDIFIAGGEKLFSSITKNYMYLCDRVYVTKYKMNFQCDQFFDFGLVSSFPLVSPVQITHDYQRHIFQCPIVHPEYEYIRLMSRIGEYGENKMYGGYPTKEIFGATIKFSVGERLPVITTRQIDHTSIISNLLLWMSGNTQHPTISDGVSTSSDISEKPSVPGWCDLPHITKRGLDDRFERGDYGPYEGFLLRHWNAEYRDCSEDHTSQGLDQLEYIITSLKTSPSSHKHILSLWNLGYYAEQLIHPQVVSVQFSLSGDGKSLDVLVTERECDVFSQLPEDITKFAVMLVVVSHLVHLKPRDVIFSLGHAYVRSQDESTISRQCKRTPRPFPLFSLRRAARLKELTDFTPESFNIEMYTSWPSLKPRD